MSAVTIKQLDDAALDVLHISDVATSTGATSTDRLGNVKRTVKGAVDSIAAFNSRGAWVTGTAYALKDLVSNGGTWYACVVAHTSSASFATDTASKWRIHQGMVAGDLSGTSGASLIGWIRSKAGAVATTLAKWLQWQEPSVFEFMTDAQIADVQADTQLLDVTTAVQNFINTIGPGKEITFPAGSYSVTQVTFGQGNQTVRMLGNAAFCARKGDTGDTITYDSVVRITAPYVTIYDLNISANYRTKHLSALRMYADGAGNYPGFVKLICPYFQAAKVGLLYGDFTSPLDAPVSENHIIGLKTRGVERCLYLNQPNGFLFVSDSVLMCEQIGWPGADFSYANALLVDNTNCVTTLTNCEFIKVSSTLGYGLSNSSSLTVNACTAEIASPNFRIRTGSETHVTGYKIHFWANSTDGFFQCDDGAVAYIQASDIKYDKPAGAAGATNGLINTSGSSGITARFNGVTMKHQQRAAIMNSNFSNIWTGSDVRIRDSVVSDGTLTRVLSMGDHNLAQGFNTALIGNYTVTAGAGTSATVAAFSGASCSYGVQIVGATGQTCTIQTKNIFPVGIQAQQRYMGLECVLGVLSATQFYGNMDALYFDDTGAQIGTQDLSNATGGIAHLTTTAGAQGYRTVRTILDVPPNCTDIAIRLSVSLYTQTVMFGGLRVY